MIYPGDGEGVRFPGVDGSEAKVRMGSGFDIDTIGKVHSYPASITWKSFDGGSGPSFPRIVVAD